MENKYLKYLFSNKEYYNELNKQYIETMGVKTKRINRNDLKDYLCGRAVLGKKYLEFLKSLEINKLDSNNTAEIGKGFCDSIFMEEKTPIITPYFSQDSFKERILKAKFIVKNGVPILINSNNEILLVTSEEIDTFVTQNIYSTDNIKGWEKLNNNYDTFNIIVGAYGLTSDSNVNEKMKQLLELRDALVNATMSFETDGEAYFASVYSKRLKK